MYRLGVVILWTAGLLGAAAPATAQSDTTPPTLHSLSVSPNVIDASQSEQTVTVTATITDDLSGVCTLSGCLATQINLSPNRIGSPTVGDFFTSVSGDTYQATLTFPQYAAHGIWIATVTVSDQAGNYRHLYQHHLLALGINVAVGVGDIESSYARSLDIRYVGKRSVGGEVDAPVYACVNAVTVWLERKTISGWRKLDKKVTRFGEGDFVLRWNGREGRFRVVAVRSDLGTPTVTSCLRATARFTA